MKSSDWHHVTTASSVGKPRSDRSPEFVGDAGSAVIRHGRGSTVKPSD